MASGRVLSVDYEVFGRVQGVFFRKHTQTTAKKLGLVGWVMNTSKGTVKGVVQGPEEKIKQMKIWLETKGSPKSRISKCTFSGEKSIPKLEFEDFAINKKHWLENTGSPESKIDKAVFEAERSISKPEFSKFDVRGY